MESLKRRKASLLLFGALITSQAYAASWFTRLTDSITECELEGYKSTIEPDGSYSVCCPNSTIHEHGKGEQLWKNSKHRFKARAHPKTNRSACSKGPAVAMVKEKADEFRAAKRAEKAQRLDAKRSERVEKMTRKRTQRSANPDSTPTSTRSMSSFDFSKVAFHAGVSARNNYELGFISAGNDIRLITNKGDIFAYSLHAGGQMRLGEYVSTFAQVNIPITSSSSTPDADFEVIGLDAASITAGVGTPLGKGASVYLHASLAEDIQITDDNDDTHTLSATKVGLTLFGNINEFLQASFKADVGTEEITGVGLDGAANLTASLPITLEAGIHYSS